MRRRSRRRCWCRCRVPVLVPVPVPVPGAATPAGRPEVQARQGVPVARRPPVVPPAATAPRVGQVRLCGEARPGAVRDESHPPQASRGGPAGPGGTPGRGGSLGADGTGATVAGRAAGAVTLGGLLAGACTAIGPTRAGQWRQAGATKPTGHGGWNAGARRRDHLRRGARPPRKRQHRPPLQHRAGRGGAGREPARLRQGQAARHRRRDARRGIGRTGRSGRGRTQGAEHARIDRPRCRRHLLGLLHDRGRHHRRGRAVGETVDGARTGVAPAWRQWTSCADAGGVQRLHIGRRGPVWRHIRLARAKRHPAEGRPGRTRGQRPGRHPDGGPCQKAHQGGRVDRTGLHRGALRHRCPPPAAIQLHPPAIMEGRKPPRGVVDPGPAPRRDPCPVALPIRHPIALHRRVPDLAVIGDWASTRRSPSARRCRSCRTQPAGACSAAPPPGAPRVAAAPSGTRRPARVPRCP